MASPALSLLLGLCYFSLLAYCQQEAPTAGTVSLWWKTVRKWSPAADRKSWNSVSLDYPNDWNPWQGIEYIYLDWRDYERLDNAEIRNNRFLLNTNQIEAGPMWPSPWTSISEINQITDSGEIWGYNTTGMGDLAKSYTRTEYFSNISVTGIKANVAGLSIRYQDVTGIPLAAINSSELGLPMAKKTNYLPPAVGTLALGDDLEKGRGILQQFKDRGNITSKFFSLHMGSVAMRQEGSLVLGGFDQRTAVGIVRNFSTRDEDGSGYLPRILLTGMRMGVESGMSPWKSTGEPGGHISFDTFMGLESTGEPAWVIPDPTVPDIYLPPGECEAIVSHLPVTYNEDVQRYLWNTTSPLYTLTIASPSWLGFSFIDDTSSQQGPLVIKVPFALLTLPLEPPLNGNSSVITHYFPCRSVPANPGSEAKYWKLGRAFLQAAFMAVDYDRNLTYLAQARGPIPDDADVPETPPAVLGEQGIYGIDDSQSAFAESWAKMWKPLDKDDFITVPRWDSKTRSWVAGVRAKSADKGSPLSPGAIAGIVVGAFAALVVVFIAYRFWRWNKEKSKERRELARQGHRGDDGSIPLTDARGNETTQNDVPPTYSEAVEQGVPPRYTTAAARS